jgi:hypothetical protein
LNAVGRTGFLAAALGVGIAFGTVIAVVGNNHSYTLPLRSMQMGNIVALDPATVARWRAAITAASV